MGRKFHLIRKELGLFKLELVRQLAAPKAQIICCKCNFKIHILIQNLLKKQQKGDFTQPVSLAGI